MKIHASIIAIILVCRNILGADDWFGYVTDFSQNAVSIIDVTTDVLGPGPILVVSNPFSIAITPDRKFAYVSAQTTQVSVVNLDSNTEVATINFPANSQGVAIAPDGNLAYISTTDSATINAVEVVDIATNTIVDTINFPANSATGAIAISPDGLKGYVINNNPSRISVFDTSDNTIITEITTNISFPVDLSITPDGQKIFVANQGGGGNVVVIDAATNIATPIIGYPAGFVPLTVAVTPDGAKAYASNLTNSSISVMDVATNTWTTDIFGLPATFAIAFSPDSQKAYVVHQSTNNVSVIDVPTDNPTGTSIPVGSGPNDIAITPDQAPIAAFTFEANPAGIPSHFDASASTTDTGFIANYVWNFGDGTPEEFTNSPLISHIYAVNGTYTVTLRLINSAGTSTAETFSFTGQTVSQNGGPSAQISQVISTITIHPPINLRGKQIKNRFATQTELINVITWQSPVEGVQPVAYRIYRDAGLTQLVANLSASQLEYFDHNRHKNVAYVYFIVSVDSEGQVSAPALIVIP